MCLKNLTKWKRIFAVIQDEGVHAYRLCLDVINDGRNSFTEPILLLLMGHIVHYNVIDIVLMWGPIAWMLFAPLLHVASINALFAFGSVWLTFHEYVLVVYWPKTVYLKACNQRKLQLSWHLRFLDHIF